MLSEQLQVSTKDFLLPDDDPIVQLMELGELEEKIGQGLHSEVYNFRPYPGKKFSTRTQWVAKLPRKHVKAMRAISGYDYERELSESLRILTEQQRHIGMPFAQTHLHGNSGLPIVIQELIPGRHITQGDPQLHDMLKIILSMNRQLFHDYGATVDMQHFMGWYLWHGPQYPTKVDNFMMHQGTPILIDTELTAVNAADPPLVKTYKSGLLLAEQNFFKQAFGLDFI